MNSLSTSSPRNNLIASLLPLFFCIALVAGCGNGGEDPQKDATSGEGTITDAPTTSCDPAVIGKTCDEDSPCGPDHTCLQFPDETTGVCACDCRPDNPQTANNEDSCPDPSKQTCGTMQMESGVQKSYCFKHCDPKIGANDCGGTIACHPASGLVAGIWRNAICLLPGCEDGLDCPVLTSQACDTTDPSSCSTGEKCIQVSYVGTDGLCGKAGTCDSASGLCDQKPPGLSKATAKVGEPCKDDTECAANQQCLREFDMAKHQKKSGATCTGDTECCSGKCKGGTCAPGLCVVRNRNGYCTILGCLFGSTLTHAACPAGSACSLWYDGGGCLKSCNMTKAEDCRNNPDDLLGDYECRNWFGVTIADMPVAASPTCEPGPLMPCDMLASAGVGCLQVAMDKNNPTKMACRDLAGTELSEEADPLGYCLDETSSGTKTRDPMPTP